MDMWSVTFGAMGDLFFRTVAAENDDFQLIRTSSLVSQGFTCKL